MISPSSPLIFGFMLAQVACILALQLFGEEGKVSGEKIFTVQYKLFNKLTFMSEVVGEIQFKLEVMFVLHPLLCEPIY